MKKKISKISSLLLVLILALALVTACKGGSDKVLAIVGEENEITEKHNDEIVELISYLNQYDMSKFSEEESAQFSESILEFSVENELMKIHLGNKDVLPKDYEQREKEFLKGLEDNKDVAKKLKENNISEETLIYYFKSQFYSQAYIEELLDKNPIKEKELEKYYEKNKSQFEEENQVKASHILIADEEGGKEKAEKIREQLVANPNSFADVAKKESTDKGSAENGGDVGFFPETGVMDEAFSKAAFALEIGEISEVVKSSFGYHIIMVTDKKDGGIAEFEDVKDEIKYNLENERYLKGIELLRKEIGVEYPGKEDGK